MTLIYDVLLYLSLLLCFQAERRRLLMKYVEEKCLEKWKDDIIEASDSVSGERAGERGKGERDEGKKT